MRARLEKAKGNAAAAARELAAFANLAGVESDAGKQAISELKESHGLLWYESLDAGVPGSPLIVGDKLINSGRSRSSGEQFIALNPASGATMWSIRSERFSDAVFDTPTQRAWYVTGDAVDPATVILYSLSVHAAGERKEFARWKRPSSISLAAIA